MKKTSAALVTATAALTIAIPPIAHATTSDGNTSDVPVLAQLAVQSPGKPSAVITIHGVRRLENSAVIYFSVGFPKGSGNAFEVLGRNYSAFGGESTSQQLGNAAVIDNKSGKAYAALNSGGNSSCFCSTKGLTSLTAGKAYVGYTEVAAIPKSVSTVSVFLGQQVFPSIPVQDGPLTPQLPTDQLSSSGSTDPAIVVGTGWPTPATKNNPALDDPQPLPTGAAQQKFIYNITTRVTQGALTQSGSALDLSGDVLFNFAKWDLTPKGKQAITAAVSKLKAAHVTAVSVTGYTDSSGSPAVNLPLSKNRAKTVANALKKQMPSLQVTQAGKGEADPVASNSTSEGRQANRRVEIVPTGGGQS